jgi:hypothetical protein
MKLLGKWVRLADGRTGHVAGSTLDGYTVVIDGKIVIAKDVTAIPPPAAAEHPQPQRTAQRPIATSHEPPPPAIVQNPHGLPVLVSGKWSDPQ